MAMRVYKLSKKLGLTNKELLDLLKEQGYSLASIALVPPEAQALVEKLMAKGTPQVQKPLSERTCFPQKKNNLKANLLRPTLRSSQKNKLKNLLSKK